MVLSILSILRSHSPRSAARSNERAPKANAIALVVMAALAPAACAEEDPALKTPRHTTTTTTGHGGAGGSTATGGGGASVGGMGPGGGGGDGGAQPIDVACAGDKAFEATGMAFVFPTPPALGAALGTLAYDPSAHPITIVLRADQHVVAASAAEGGVFVENPSWSAATVDLGGFATVEPQAAAVLRLVDPDGGAAIDIALEHVALWATTAAGCSYATVLLDAVIPSSQAAVEIPVDDTEQPLGELADGSGGGGGSPSGWLLRGFFQAQTTSFDFTSLEP